MDQFPSSATFAGIPMQPPIQGWQPFDMPGASPTARMLAMLAGQALQPAMAQHGYIQGSPFAGFNFGTTSRNRDVQNQMQAAMTQMRYAEMANMRSVIQGIGAQFGADPAQTAEFAKPLAELYSNPFALQLMAQHAPGLMSQLGGNRGSAYLMNQNLMQAGRYARDPLTGQRGMSGSTIAAVGQHLWDSEYANQITPRIGITADRFGALAHELMVRGQISGLDEGTVAQEAMDRINRTGSPEARDALKNATGRNIDKPGVREEGAKVIADKLKVKVGEYAGTMDVMKEMFAEMGQPDAPMGKLFATMEQITQQSQQQLDPIKLKGLVRDINTALTNSRLSLEHFGVLQQTMGGFLEQRGVNQAFSTGATLDTVRYRTSFQQGGFGSFGFGSMTADKAAILHQQLTASAVKSPAAGMAATAISFAENGDLIKGSDLDLLTRALKEGRSTWTNRAGETRGTMFRMQESDQLTRIIQGGMRARVDAGIIAEQYQDFDANQPNIFKYNLGEAARWQQRELEVMPKTSAEFALRARSRMAGQVNMSEAQMAAASEVGVRAALESNGNLEERRKAMVDATMAELARQGVRGNATTMRALLASAYDSMNGAHNQSQELNFGMAAGDNFWAGLSQTQSARLERQQEVTRAQERADSRVDEALRPLSEHTMVRRVVTAMERSDPRNKAGFIGVLAESVGGEQIDKLWEELTKNGVIGRAAELRARMDNNAAERAKLQSEIDSNKLSDKDVKNRQDRLKALSDEYARDGVEYGGLQDNIKDAMGRAGVDLDTAEERARIADEKAEREAQAKKSAVQRKMEKIDEAKKGKDDKEHAAAGGEQAKYTLVGKDMKLQIKVLRIETNNKGGGEVTAIGVAMDPADLGVEAAAV